MSDERCRLRDLGLKVGTLDTGELNSITDVPGVKVGHCTIIEGEGKLVPGKAPIRTGVTVIIPHEGNVYREKVFASSFIMNGYGKTIGLVQLEELGLLESIIALTNTLNIPKVADALIDYHITQNPNIGVTGPTINVVVGECNDGILNDIQGRHVTKEHIFEAINNASATVEEGSVGAGTGMITFGYKGGIGTSSRKATIEDNDVVLGILVLSNFGHKDDLTILGRKFKLISKEEKEVSKEKGSIMVIIATNAPLNSRQLKRIAKRAPLGISRTGSYISWGSGDVIIAFSNKQKLDFKSKPTIRTTEILNEESILFSFLLKATVEATEEAILNSIMMATTLTGRDNYTAEAISIEKVKELLSE